MHLLFAFSLVVYSALAIESNFYREETCTSVGGYCVLEAECHHPVPSYHQGLCPSQRGAGAVCCTDFPLENLNCKQLHSTCRAECPSVLNRGSRGCPSGEVCCDDI